MNGYQVRITLVQGTRTWYRVPLPDPATSSHPQDLQGNGYGYCMVVSGLRSRSGRRCPCGVKRDSDSNYFSCSQTRHSVSVSASPDDPDLGSRRGPPPTAASSPFVATSSPPLAAESGLARRRGTEARRPSRDESPRPVLHWQGVSLVPGPSRGAAGTRRGKLLARPVADRLARSRSTSGWGQVTSRRSCRACRPRNGRCC